MWVVDLEGVQNDEVGGGCEGCLILIEDQNH